MKTIDIKGKKYVPVNERIKYFWKNFEKHAIITDFIRITEEDCICKATILNENNQVVATGHAQEFRNASALNKTNFIANCETSAIGRALGILGIGIDEAVASADELNLAIERQNIESRKVTKAELGSLKMRCEDRGRDFNMLLTYYDRKTPEELSFGDYMHAMKLMGDK